MMYCVGAQREEENWEALWEKRQQEAKQNAVEKATEKRREAQRRYLKKYRETHREQRNEIVRRSQRKRRDAARENGMCIQCCVREPAPGRKSCAMCLQRSRDYARKRREEHDAKRDASDRGL